MTVIVTRPKYFGFCVSIIVMGLELELGRRVNLLELTTEIWFQNNFHQVQNGVRTHRHTGTERDEPAIGTNTWQFVCHVHSDVKICILSFEYMIHQHCISLILLKAGPAMWSLTFASTRLIWCILVHFTFLSFLYNLVEAYAGTNVKTVGSCWWNPWEGIPNGMNAAKIERRP